MSVQMAKAKIKTESVSDVQAAAKKLFAAINPPDSQTPTVIGSYRLF